MRILIAFFTLFLVSSFSKPVQHSSNYIKIVVTGMKEIKGKVRVGIFNSPDGFPVTGNQYKGFEYPVTGTKMTITIPNIEKGKYAIGIMQDLNGNGKLDKNVIGYPSEIYGFSNNSRGTFSAPTYESASFYHDGSTTLNIEMY